MKKHSDIIETLEEVRQGVQVTPHLKERSVNVEDVDVYQIRQKYHLNAARICTKFGFSFRILQQNKGNKGDDILMDLLSFF